MKTRVIRYVNKCSNCGTENISNHILSDIKCIKCGAKTTLENWFINEKEVELKKGYINHSLSVITNSLDVYVEMPFYLSSKFLFTINNPEIREGFPQVEFPSQYREKEIVDKINDWIYKNFFDVLKKLI